MSALYRLNRFFNAESNRALDVAIDHGGFGEPTFLKGIENIDTAVRTLVGAAPDAIQLTLGQSRVLQGIPGKQKPALVMRCDVANVYSVPLDDYLFSHHFPHAVEEAVRLDAACVVANLIHVPGRPQIREANIMSLMQLRAECTRYGMPLMIEPLVMQVNDARGAYMVDGDTKKIVTLVRQAVEIGADLIKADPTSTVADYHLVIEAAGSVPLLVRGGGGGRTDIDLLRLSAQLLEQGARGLVYGRNIIQHRDPAGITRALMAVLHDNVSPEDALSLVSAA